MASAYIDHETEITEGVGPCDGLDDVVAQGHHRGLEQRRRFRVLPQPGEARRTEHEFEARPSSTHRVEQSSPCNEGFAPNHADEVARAARRVSSKRVAKRSCSKQPGSPSEKIP